MNFNGIFFSSKQFSVQGSLNEERISIDYLNFNTWLGGFKREHCKILSMLHAKENSMLGCAEIPSSPLKVCLLLATLELESESQREVGVDLEDH